MGFDGRQSYEDKIVPVRKSLSGDSIPGLPSWEELTSIFLVRATSGEVYDRCKRDASYDERDRRLRFGKRNSIPDYVPAGKLQSAFACGTGRRIRRKVHEKLVRMAAKSQHATKPCRFCPFPQSNFLVINIRDLIWSADHQVAALRVIKERCPISASVSMMDLSVSGGFGLRDQIL